jgi:hypothetical protein
MRYPYVGPVELAEGTRRDGPRGLLVEGGDVGALLEALGEDPGADRVTLTYTVGEDGDLRVASRHSEHVACAGGVPVRAAGELTVVRAERGWEVEDVTNQSTGYCPEPTCWPAARDALERAGLAPPEAFTRAFVFRTCRACGALQIVKEGWFVCAECGEDLPRGR